MNAKSRRRIFALDIPTIAEELDELFVMEQGIDGKRGSPKVLTALEAAREALFEVEYLASTPRKDWD